MKTGTLIKGNIDEKIHLKQFIKLPLADQARLLRERGLFLDQDENGGQQMNLYFMNGYFVEESIILGKPVEILPFINGYRLANFTGNDPVNIP